MGNLFLSKERVVTIVNILQGMSRDCELFKGLTTAIAEDHPETADLIHRLAFIVQTRSVEAHNEIVEANMEMTKHEIQKEADDSKVIVEAALEGQNV